MCKKHEEPSSGRNNPYFPGLREAIFHGRFLSEIPKSRLFYPPSGNLGNLGGLKVHTCAFVIFGLLTRWLAGSEWVMGSKMGSRTAWIGRPGRKSGLMLRKLGKKGATALFIITEQRHRLNGAQRPIVAAKLNRFENFLLTPLLLCIIKYMHLAHCICIWTQERDFNWRASFFHSAPPSRLGTMISPSNKKQIHCRHDGKICWCRTCNS